MSKVPYASAIDNLMYVMVCTRSDIAHEVGVVNRFMSRTGKQHWEAVKWILRYLKGSLDTCLCFTSASFKLQGYVDADFADDIDSRKKAEYVVATKVGKKMIWLHGFIDELVEAVRSFNWSSSLRTGGWVAGMRIVSWRIAI
ncbi:Retrovirus-related Pol polyprotein from transposon TNT 1-94 [Vitis vinifera]|uniref:Retrovirus-related Pol polyprotein from transposon TNT 1-94 n=1 Tax=Vitis vinifera TaxID=29760 RepID=A0A438GGC3_VITVI|nr:Retrovirus-related Pol polyprotein from transposon TNT 1-94 [Vitis vinifera]